MNRNQIEEQIMQFHISRGGFGGCSSGHSLRLLREVIELCVACGASAEDIESAVGQEVRKAETREEIGEENKENIREEVSDVDILLTVFKFYFTGSEEDRNRDLVQKLEVCCGRQWKSDADGVLWRPGVIPAAFTGTEAESS